MNGHFDVVKLLLLKGASPNTKSLDRITPLHFAVLNCHYKVINLLLSCPDIDINIQNKDKYSAKDLAFLSSNGKLKDYFNENKRKNLVQLTSLQEEKNDLEASLLSISKALEKANQAQVVATQKLDDENSRYLLLLEKIQNMRKNNCQMDICRDDSSYLEEINQLKASLEMKKKRNVELETYYYNEQVKSQIQEQQIKDVILDSHDSMSNVMSLMDTANMSIINLKTCIESTKDLIIKL